MIGLKAMGHLVPSEEVINAFKDINKTFPMKNVLEFGFNTGGVLLLF